MEYCRLYGVQDSELILVYFLKTSVRGLSVCIVPSMKCGIQQCIIYGVHWDSSWEYVFPDLECIKGLCVACASNANDVSEVICKIWVFLHCHDGASKFAAVFPWLPVSSCYQYWERRHCSLSDARYLKSGCSLTSCIGCCYEFEITDMKHMDWLAAVVGGRSRRADGTVLLVSKQSRRAHLGCQVRTHPLAAGPQQLLHSEEQSTWPPNCDQIPTRIKH